jgi:hydroxymethylbilane synthase
MSRPLRLGTRGSQLALWQANYVAEQIRRAAPSRVVELVEIQTAGDTIRDAPLVQISGQGVFTKEIQRALQTGAVDVAVHSLKDLPTFPVDNLTLAAVPPRGPTGDAFVSLQHRAFAVLPRGAILATSSLRRRAQLLFRRPDLQLVNIRGNVETRLRKLAEQGLDGLVLAQAGLERLGLGDQITEILDPSWMLPAVGQGALGLECRADDADTRTLLERLDNLATHRAVLAERALLRGLGGGCQVPVGAVTESNGEALSLRGVVISPDGSRRVEGRLAGPAQDAEELGCRLADLLLEQGAGELLGRP